jgi:hypothetical protein
MTIDIIPRWAKRRQEQGARLKPLMKAVLVHASLRLMASRRTGRLATQLVRRVVTTLVRRGGLASA